MSRKSRMKGSKPFKAVFHECPHCGHSFERYANYWGTMCPHCSKAVPATTEHPIVRHNRQKREKLCQEVIQSIIERQGRVT